MLLRPFYTTGTPSSKANYFAIINQSNENRKQRNRENCRSGKNNCVSETDETNKRVCPMMPLKLIALYQTPYKQHTIIYDYRIVHMILYILASFV